MKKLIYIPALVLLVIIAITQNSCNTASRSQQSAADTLAKVSKIQLIREETFPVHISVKIDGILPDTCTTFRNIEQRRKDNDNVFHINLITNPHPGKTCSSSEAPFELEVPLELDGLPKGKYKVDVNGKTETFELKQDNEIE